jgi:streptogramin lyase
MLFRTFKSVMIALAFGAVAASAQDFNAPIPSRRLTEYQMPPTTETHEFARMPGTNMVLLTQMSNSNLVKIDLDPTTEEFVALHSFRLRNEGAGLHGVWPSAAYPGRVWLSLQFENKLLLVNPGKESWTTPIIEWEIDIPAPGNGPHCVFEIGDRVWAGLKEPSKQTGKYYVFSANVRNAADYRLYESPKSPVFIKQDPTSGWIYVTQDSDSSLMRIDVPTGRTEQLPIPPSVGNTPVGLTASYSRNMWGVWFTLAGDNTGGIGTFGHIASNRQMRFFRLRNPLGARAGLLHIADATIEENRPALWLLSTSLLSKDSPDALIHVTFDAGVTSIVGEEYISMPTQDSKVHRVLPLDKTVLVSELSKFTLAQVSYRNTVAGKWQPANSVSGSAVNAEEY